MLLGGGGAFAIPLESLCVVTDAEALAAAMGVDEATEEVGSVAREGCPTYVRGFTLDLQRR